ncbi:alkaline phosphatase, partial [Salinibacter altiplanensis]|uniref:alkaline phosphatase n=1 Tax=Salinibacter altiplanensis TaxID=1803181 RepID=UPI001F3AC41A
AGTANGQPRTDVSGIEAPGDAKNIIFLVSDGMSAGTLTMADLHLRRHHGRRSNWLRLYEEGRVRHGLMDMASANSIVTGSAAAASSWGSGHRVFNEAVNMSEDGEEYRTILEIFRDAGKGTGLVTTTRITHATPSGFGINMPARWSEDKIAAQHLEREYDVLMGGGARHFDSDQRDDGQNLFQAFEDKGYTVAQSKSGLNTWGHEGAFLGTFYDTHLPYVLDHQNISSHRQRVPRLPKMTDAALQRLSQNNDGFLLQVEGGRVDHAAHEDDTGGLVYDQVEFDEAIGTALDFAEGRDDTLAPPKRPAGRVPGGLPREERSRPAARGHPGQLHVGQLARGGPHLRLRGACRDGTRQRGDRRLHAQHGPLRPDGGVGRGARVRARLRGEHRGGRRRLREDEARAGRLGNCVEIDR